MLITIFQVKSNIILIIWYKPACVSEWCFKWDKLLNDLSHWLHGYGFSPVCVRKWYLRPSDLWKRLSQCSQAYGRGIPSWIVFLCQFKLDELQYDLLHRSQMNVFDIRFGSISIVSFSIEQSERFSFAPSAAATAAASAATVVSSFTENLYSSCEWSNQFKRMNKIHL